MALTPVVLLFAVAASACRDGAAETAEGAGIEQTKAVTLRESDTAYIARIGGFAVGAGGAVFVSDVLNANVLQFDAAGVLTRRIGRRGRGPGEFIRPGAIGVSDSLVYVVNGGFELNAFRLPAADFEWKRLLPTRPVFNIRPSPQGLIINVSDSARHAVIGLVSGQNDSARYVRLYPSPLGRSRAVDAWYSYPVFSTWSDDSVVVAIEASDHLFWGALGHQTFDSIAIPRRRRRGSRPDLYRKVTPDPTTMRPLLYRTSHPWAIKRLSSGLVAYVVTDQEYARNRFSGDMFVSLVDRERRTVCADVPIRVPKDPQPWVTFVGDTLAVLLQDVDSSGKPFAQLRHFVFRPEACSWIAAQ